MRFSIGKNNGYYSRSKRLTAARSIAFMVCIFFIAASVLSAAFIFIHTGHIHDQADPIKNCATCVHLSTAENLLKTFSTALAFLALIYAGLSAVLSEIKSAGIQYLFYSLVRLKVRLNN